MKYKLLRRYYKWRVQRAFRAAWRSGFQHLEVSEYNALWTKYLGHL